MPGFVSPFVGKQKRLWRDPARSHRFSASLPKDVKAHVSLAVGELALADEPPLSKPVEIFDLADFPSILSSRALSESPVAPKPPGNVADIDKVFPFTALILSLTARSEGDAGNKLTFIPFGLIKELLRRSEAM
mmetsp:Transcript_46609/g.84090  ORF Transcript_46609/g.84090 Transcript_46609/m.84090 type:complete len:133 (-) Transcript_46609:179-577(-)